MSLQTNIERLFWRFQNGTFKPNQKDLDALVYICEWINRQKEQQKDNTLLSKLYILLFMNHVHLFEDLKFAQYSLHSKLEKPISYFIDEFAERLNLIEFKKFCKLKNINLDLTELDDEKQMEIIKENQEEYLKLSVGKWTNEKVEKSLLNQITEVINNYKNKP